jgi:hypothetical protein
MTIKNVEIRELGYSDHKNIKITLEGMVIENVPKIYIKKEV